MEEEEGGEGRERVGVEGERRGECVSGMGEEGRPLWAGVIREPFMGETITGCDSGAPAEVSAAAVCQPRPQPASQPASTLLNSALSHARLHTYTLLPLEHIWPSLICCIRKDGGELKGGERERQRNVKKKKKKSRDNTT